MLGDGTICISFGRCTGVPTGVVTGVPWVALSCGEVSCLGGTLTAFHGLAVLLLYLLGVLHYFRAVPVLFGVMELYEYHAVIVLASLPVFLLAFHEVVHVLAYSHKVL